MRENYPEVAAKTSINTLGGMVDHNPTVEENIDNRINSHRKEIERLEQAKLDLGPLLKMRIRDVRSAMDLY